MARAESKTKDGAAPYLEQGEEILAAIVARPRGWTQQTASPGGGAAAEESGFEITSPMALAVATPA